MRFGWLAAAAAMVCASQVSAETITQAFNATLTNNGSTGPISVGKLGLDSQRVIRSATVFYDATQGVSVDYTRTSFPDVTTITYSGSVGFGIFPLPVPIFATNSFSGTQACANGNCNPAFSLVGTLAVPTADLPAFAGLAELFISPQGAINYSVTTNGMAGILQQQVRFSGVRGRIVYEVDAVPEPASWAMMILGVGLVGAAARRKRTAALSAS